MRRTVRGSYSKRAAISEAVRPRRESQIMTRLTIEHVAEFGDRPVPVILAIRARKRGRHE